MGLSDAAVAGKLVVKVAVKLLQVLYSVCVSVCVYNIHIRFMVKASYRMCPPTHRIRPRKVRPHSCLLQGDCYEVSYAAAMRSAMRY